MKQSDYQPVAKWRLKQILIALTQSFPLAGAHHTTPSGTCRLRIHSCLSAHSTVHGSVPGKHLDTHLARAWMIQSQLAASCKSYIAFPRY